MNNKNENEKKGEGSQQSKDLMRRMAFTTLKSGCLTLLAAGAAIAIGLIIDIRQDTFPRWTLIFLVGSMPFTLIGLYFIVRREIKKIQQRDQINNGQPQDPDNDSI
jgi:hypothetical protein